MDLSISEIKNINKVVNQYFDVDLLLFGAVSLKSRLLSTMGVFDFRNSTDLINGISNNVVNKDSFLHYFAVPYTEMFRDPSMWRVLKTELSKINKDRIYKIYVPACTTGDEYYTLLVLIHELNLIDNVRITVSSWSDKAIESIKKISILPKKMELNSANYKRFEGNDGLAMYFETNVIKDLLLKTNFINVNLITDKLPTNQDLIIFRNKFIYLNDDAQIVLLDKFYSSMKIGAKLVVGIKENIFLKKSVKDKFIEECETERIY